MSKLFIHCIMNDFFKKQRTWVEVSESAIKHNINSVKDLLENDSDLVCVVKSNAYGHGILNVAKVAYRQKVRRFAVDSIEEALQLRELFEDVWILVMGYIIPARLKEAIEKDISFVAYSESYLPYIGGSQKMAKVHLKIETGTMRQGLYGAELFDYANKLSVLPNVEIEGMYTHFANIEDTTDHGFAFDQLGKFNQVARELELIGIKPKLKHVACSAAIILLRETHFDLVRLGISLYGLWSSKETRVVSQANNIGFALKPALRWKSKIAQVKYAEAGTCVSYGLTECVSRKSKLAVVPVGYWDGYDRGLSSIGHVLVKGIRCKVVGRICMNMMVIDVTDVADPKCGDEVVLLGRQNDDEISADDIAAKLHTINYEVVTRINPTIPRFVV